MCVRERERERVCVRERERERERVLRDSCNMFFPVIDVPEDGEPCVSAETKIN